MKKSIFITFLACYLITSCNNNSSTASSPLLNSDNVDTATVTISNEKVHVAINSPEDIFQTDYISFEVLHHEPSDSRGTFSLEKSDGYKDVTSIGAKCWNLIFYNTKTKDYYLLEPTKKFLIYDYKLNDTANGKIVRNLARFDIQFDDNKDGKFTNADAKRMYVSSRLGKGFHQVSPEGVSVQSYQFSPKENFIVIHGIKDTNKDGLFDNKDRVFIYRLNLNQVAESIEPAQILFTKTFQDSLQKRVEIDWKLPNN